MEKGYLMLPRLHLEGVFTPNTENDVFCTSTLTLKSMENQLLKTLFQS